MQLIKRDIRHLVDTSVNIMLIFLNVTYKVVFYTGKFFIVGLYESVY